MCVGGGASAFLGHNTTWTYYLGLGPPTSTGEIRSLYNVLGGGIGPIRIHVRFWAKKKLLYDDCRSNRTSLKVDAVNGLIQ